MDKEVGRLLVKVCRRSLPPLARARPDLPPELVAIIERCLAKDRALRYENAGQLGLELARFRAPPSALCERLTAYAAAPGFSSLARDPEPCMPESSPALDPPPNPNIAEAGDQAPAAAPSLPSSRPPRLGIWTWVVAWLVALLVGLAHRLGALARRTPRNREGSPQGTGA